MMKYVSVSAIALSVMSAASSAAVLDTSTWSFNGGAQQTTGGQASASAKIGDYITYYDVLGDGTTNWVISIAAIHNAVSETLNDLIYVNSPSAAVASAPFVYHVNNDSLIGPSATWVEIATKFVSAVDGAAVTLNNVRLVISDLDSGDDNKSYADFVASANAGFGTVSPETTALGLQNDTITGLGGQLAVAKKVDGSWAGVPNINGDRDYEALLQYASMSEDTIALGTIFEEYPTIVQNFHRGTGIFSAEVDVPLEPEIPVSPVPLPAAAWLMIGGFAALGSLKRRKRS